MAENKSVRSASKPANFSILGTYEGECADSTITNENGLDITREVWENVFDSDEYAKALDHGWYIGFLGHPDDPNCMDFEHACIVMTEGHIDDNGKVYGKFNLIDTPVGRIVKAFQDAGVIFGISVRGAGDIISNSVDPDTFVFRGFDLVTFPAFPESIPTFSEIAASTDRDKRARYKAVCSAVNSNLDKITSSEALQVIQSQFASQSDEYKAIEARKCELTDEECEDLTNQKLVAMTNLYLEAVEAASALRSELDATKKALRSAKIESSRKISSIQRIMSAQIADVSSERDKATSECKKYVIANKRLKAALSSTSATNLKYKQKVEACDQQIREKDSVISRLRTELDETVTAAEHTEQRASNLGGTNKTLRQDVVACEAIIADYQQAYGNLYANAIGVSLDSITVTAATTVKELQEMIGGSTRLDVHDSAETEEVDVVDDISDYDLITV